MEFVRVKQLLLIVLVGFGIALPSAAGTLIGSYAPVPTGTDIDLTIEGALDWVHWGTYTEFASDRKAAVVAQISEYSAFNGFPDDGPFQYADNYNSYSWHDGVPTASVTGNISGVYELGRNNGLQFTVPADTTPRVLRVYVGTYAARGSFQASLNEANTPTYNNSLLDNYGNGPGMVYTLIYAASTSNKVLTIKWSVATPYALDGNVTLQAAALSYYTNNNPPTAWIESPVNKQAFAAPGALSIEASAIDPDGSITNLEFFEGTNKLGEVAEAPYSVMWTNVPMGTFTLTVRATDNLGESRSSPPIEVFGYRNGGSLTGTFSASPAAVVLSTDGTHDWAHWGLLADTSFDHKGGVAPEIPDFVKLGTNLARSYPNDFTAWSWTGGTVTESATNSTTGVLMNGFTNGFELNLPADTNARTIKVYVGISGARGLFQALLSDYSAAPFVDTSLINLYENSLEQGVYRSYVLNYAAASDHQILKVRFTAGALYDLEFGEVDIESASLASDKPLVLFASPTNDARFFVPGRIPLVAQAFDRNGTVALVEFFEGTNKLGQSTNTPFSLVWSNVPGGVHTVTARAMDNDRVTSFSAPLTVRVVTNQPPSVAVTAPTNNAKLAADADITLAASASDSDGTIRLVEFFEGANKLGESTNAPFTLVWPFVAEGTYTLRAKATDDYGDWTISNPVGILVTNEPISVSIIDPRNNATFFTPVNISITARVPDVQNLVARVEFFRDGISLGDRTNGPYTLVWSNAPRGRFTLTAEAYDRHGRPGVSAPVVITVTNSPPIPGLTRPAPGDKFFEGTNITLTASPVDPDGFVTLVELFLGTNKLSELTNPPYEMILSNVTLGSYQFAVRVTDNEGATASSAAIVNVISNQSPTVTVTSPTNGQTFFTPVNVLLSAQASDPDGFISRVEYFAGTNKLGEVTNPPFSLIWTSAPRGTFTVTARARDNWRGSNSASVTIKITNSPPSVSLTNPLPGSVFFAATNITLQAQAIDLDGSIKQVEFFAGTNKLGQVTNSPYQLVWTNVPLGTFQITAKATDNELATKVSAAVAINVVSNQRPSVTLLGPTNGQTFITPVDIPITAQASDPDGFISRVEFFAGASKLAEVTNPPYSLLWTNPPHGTFALTVRAFDNWRGSNSASATISISNSPPIVSLINPLPGAVFFEGTNITLRAQAADADGTISRVEFFLTTTRKTTKLGEATNSPYAFVWSNAPLGTFQITAQATDNDLETRVTSPVSINVVPNQLPTVTLLSPTNGQTFFTPLVVPMTAQANDPDGFISRVEFFAGANKLGEVTNPPYSLIWTSPPHGTFALTARAFDNWRGSNSASATINISNSPPTVSLTNPLPGAVFFEGTNITLHAQAADADGAISKVEFFMTTRRTTKLGEITNSPYALVWSNAPLGTFQLTAQATDNHLATSVSSPVSINVVANQLPSVTLLSPTNGQVFFTPFGVPITAQAIDPDGFISRVEFFAGTNKLGEVTNPPYSLTWTGAPRGTFSLVARATDNWRGSNSTSVTILITNSPPTIALISPLPGTIFFGRTNITLQAQATDPDGSIKQVEFFAGTNKLGQVTNSPYQLIWSNAPLGIFQLTAKATDNELATKLSTSVTINIVPVVRLFDPKLAPSRFVFSFFGETNWTYRVEWSPALAPVNWQLMTNIQGRGAIVSVTNEIISTVQRFYRVLAQ